MYTRCGLVTSDPKSMFTPKKTSKVGRFIQEFVWVTSDQKSQVPKKFDYFDCGAASKLCMTENKKAKHQRASSLHRHRLAKKEKTG